MNVTLWDTSSDVRKELSIQDDRTESDNRIEVMLLIGIAENNLPHIARWESTKPPYAEPHVRWCGRSVNVKIGGKCLLWLAFTSYPIYFLRWCWASFIKLSLALEIPADYKNSRIWVITSKEIYNFVHQRVVEASGNRQHPVMWGKFDGNMPVIKWWISLNSFMKI